MPLVLASSSPRRRQLLQVAGIPVARIASPDVDESRHPGEDPVACARRLARDKAAAVARDEDEHVLAADTVVHIDGALFDKPRDADHAADILRGLSGRWHRVTTAWCLDGDGSAQLGHVTTQVRFRALQPAEIAGYVATGDGLDKAGAYGIQSLGAGLVAELSGSYTNVVGLPMEEVMAALAAAGIEPEAP